MGMYTELFVEGTLLEKVPPVVEKVIKFLFDRENNDEPATLPDHPFFKCPRWTCIGTCNSFYHVPMALSGVGTNHTKQLSFVSRSDLKDYDDEIKKFLDWLNPYCELLRGWEMYEEDEKPTMFFYEKSYY